MRTASPTQALEDARRKLSAGRDSAGRTVTREDVLDRYTGGAKPSVGRPIKGDKDARSDAGKRPATDRPTGDRPTVGRPAAGRPTTGRPVAGKPRTDAGTGGRPGKVDVGAGSRPGARPIAGARPGRNPLKDDRAQAHADYVKNLGTARPIGGRPMRPGTGSNGATVIGDTPGRTPGAAPARPGSTYGRPTHVGNPRWGSGGYYDSCYWNTWGHCYGSAWGSWLCSPFYLSGYWWQSYWYNGGSWGFGWNWPRRTWSPYRNCYWYGPFLPASYSIVVYDDPEPETEVIYVEVPVEQEPVDEYVVYGAGDVVGDAAPAPTPATVQTDGTYVAPIAGAKVDGDAADTGTDEGLVRALNRASAYYLTQGDRAFRETRYGDAVHFYAKSVEFSPDSGILYLVLSDALFATGDYRYAAFALRQAADREPDLFENVVDKRAFYAEPSAFDEQLAQLEGFVEDHVLDMDARLVLAANYLFGGRADLAVGLLEAPFSEELRQQPAGKLLWRVARKEIEPR